MTTLEIKPGDYHAFSDPDFPNASATELAEKNRNRQILEQLPGRESIAKEKERLAKLEAEIEQKERQRVARYNSYEQLVKTDIPAAQRVLNDCAYYEQEAKQFAADADYTLQLHFLEGKHPQFGTGAPPYVAFGLAAQAVGAKHFLEVMAKYRPEAEARLASLLKRAEDEAKELGLDKAKPAEDSSEDLAPKKYKL